MDNQEVFEKLSDIECYLFYEIDQPTENTSSIDPEKLKAFHNAIDEALQAWHDLTGCTLMH